MRAALDGHVALVGPNCMGVISSECRLHATGFVAVHPHAGGLSVISQSGNVGYKMLKLADTRGAGISKFVGVGNEALVSSVDVLEFLGADPHTDVILMYLEGVKDGRRLMDIARRTTLQKPIVVVRGGMTASEATQPPRTPAPWPEQPPSARHGPSDRRHRYNLSRRGNRSGPLPGSPSSSPRTASGGRHPRGRLGRPRGRRSGSPRARSC